MDASSTQEFPEVVPPRNLFFNVEDRLLGGRTGLTDKHVTVERIRRHQLAEHVINSAIQVANAVRTMRTFDKTGNADQALGHLECSLEDLCKQTRNLMDEVEKSVDRYGDGLDALHARDAEEARAALNTPAAAEPPTAAAGPKPGPGPVVVLVQEPPLSMTKPLLTDEAFAHMQVKKNLERALDRQRESVAK
jgi:hypothetical protein